MSVKLGFNGAAFYGNAGGDPGTALPRIISITPSEAMGKIAANDRDNKTRNINLPGRKDGSFDIELHWDDEGAALTALVALRDAYDNRTLIALKFLDKVGGKGSYADFHVFNWSRSEPDEGAMTVSVNVEIFGNFTRV